jgi:hypothetical protein
MAKKKLEQFVSPTGSVTWASVVRPSTKFKALGSYDISIALTKEQALPLIKKFTEIGKAYHTEVAAEKPVRKKYELHLPIKPEVDPETGEETGRYILKASQAAAVDLVDKKTGKTDRRTFRITVVDAKKQPCAPRVGRDSTAKFVALINPTVHDASKKVFVSLRLQAVQILNLVEFGGGGDGTDAFGEEEGFVAPEESEGESTEVTPDGSSDSADDDF